MKNGERYEDEIKTCGRDKNLKMKKITYNCLWCSFASKYKGKHLQTS